MQNVHLLDNTQRCQKQTQYDGHKAIYLYCDSGDSFTKPNSKRHTVLEERDEHRFQGKDGTTYVKALFNVMSAKAVIGVTQKLDEMLAARPLIKS